MSNRFVLTADDGITIEEPLAKRVDGGRYTMDPVDARAYEGEQVLTRRTLTKKQTGDLGEALIVAYLGGNARNLGHLRNNFPIDLRHGDKLIEVKSGLVSNKPDSMKWRANIGEPGRAEKAWMASLSPEDRRAWYDHKKAALMRRKHEAVRKIAKALGRTFKPVTMMTIINPDTRICDIFAMQGFHREIRWRSDEMADAYEGSFRYTRRGA